jgi:hypothetical protein
MMAMMPQMTASILLLRGHFSLLLVFMLLC